MNTNTLTPNPNTTAEMNVAPWWKLWANPLILRYARSRLRFRRSAGLILTVFIVTSFTFFIIYLTSVNRDIASHRDAARGVLMPMFIIQGIVMMLMGTGSVASGLAKDKIDGTMDYQRLTPMSPLAKIVGYLFGLPIREYVLFAITLPYTIYALIVGRIPFDVFVPVYLIFFTSVILYHLTGMAAGMIMKRWRLTAWLTQGLVLLLYWVLPQFSHLGLYGFQYLTVRPVLAAELFPMIPPEFRAGLDPSWQGIDSVPFFIWEFSSFWFSFVLQSLLVVTLGTMSYRKWRDQNQHALSKQFGVGFFALVVLMILGNIWPIISGNTQVSLPILGGLSGGHVDDGVAVALPLIMSFALLFAGIWVLSMVTPGHHEVLRGWRRVVKFDENKLGWWRNESPAGLILAILIGISILGVGTELWMLSSNGFLPTEDVSFLDRVYLPLALVVGLLSFYSALISLENRRIFIVLLLGWGLPVLLAVFLGAAFSSYKLAMYISSLSPIFLLVYGALYLESVDLNNADVDEYQVIGEQAFWIGLVIQILFISWLLFRWSKLYAKLVSISKTGSKDIPVSLLEQEIDD